MSIHFQRELINLRKHILTVGTAVEDAISKAILALLKRDEKLAGQVVEGDRTIDRMEVEVEEECLKILALYQPVANDLRFIVAVLKMNNDLERMGDHAANIAKRARFLAGHTAIHWPNQLETMADQVKAMVKSSLDALINHNGELARKVCSSDATVDAMKRSITSELRNQLIEQNQEYRELLISMIEIPRHLERIADLATNIAEDVIYLTEGAILRHHRVEDE